MSDNVRTGSEFPVPFRLLDGDADDKLKCVGNEERILTVGTFEFQEFSRRHRPHFQPPGATLFLTYRLAGSIPQSTVRLYRAKKKWLEDAIQRARRLEGPSESSAWLERAEAFKREWFLRYEEILHKADVGPKWLQDESVATKVAEGLARLDDDAYRLDAYSIMSNHVHAVFKPLLSEQELRQIFSSEDGSMFVSQHPSLSKIMQSLKGRSARECNLILNRTGQFWEHESFDHVIRPGKFLKTVRYVLNNPLKAGLVNNWRDWRWNYCRSELLEEL